MKVAIVVGTRPEIIKMAPVIRAAQKDPQVKPLIWHSGQHYSFDMDQQIFNDLELPPPDINFSVGSGSHAIQTGKIMAKLEEIMIKDPPHVVLVQGDTNTVLGATLAASKLHIPVGHVEAGLRSYDRSMPEEINRIICDHVADVLYPPTKKARDILRSEGIAKDKIVITGNTAVDAALQSLELAKRKSEALSDLIGKQFEFFTLHRAENVDHKHKLQNVITALQTILDEHPLLEIVWSVHPRTRKQLELFGLSDIVAALPRLRLINPLGYLDTLLMQSEAAVVMTDSGGLQEEACVLGTPCITLRDNTERPESVEVGANELVGTDTEKIISAVRHRLSQQEPLTWKNPFGNGTAGETIIQDVINRFGKQQTTSGA